jgi:hypothetical protein
MSIIFQDMLIDKDLGSLDNRAPVTCVDQSLTSLPASPAVSITVDSSVSLQAGDRVLFTALTNPAENNMIYKVESHGSAGLPQQMLNLVLDTSGRNPSGAPVKGDFCRVQSGSSAGDLFGWNGSIWANVSFSTL